MAGLYIHIPFCKSRCIYCGFYSTTRMELRQRYVDALCREMSLRPATADTIYIGGGTPSQLTTAQLRQLFAHIARNYPAAAPHGAEEVTIEMNPDDVTPAYAAALSELPVNRVSMGAQTFDDRRLRFLHRRHSASQVHEAVRLLRQAGVGNVSIDLMYGFPGETLDDWQRDIDAALALGVEHISAYCLMVEEGTVLYEQMRNEKSGMRNGDEGTRSGDERGSSGDERASSGGEGARDADELERLMYETLIDRLTAAGYEHYEISNFARPGYRSRHNQSYWHDVPYIGLGAAAHSYDGACRSWNVSNLQQYIDAIERGELPSEREVIDADTHYNDLVATALRTSDGLSLDCLSPRHRSYCLREARPFLDDGLLRLANSQPHARDGQLHSSDSQLHSANGQLHSSDSQLHATSQLCPPGSRLVLTRRGLFVSDYIMSSLMFI